MPAAPDRLLSPPRRGGRRAFTIVEVMVAAGVMALVLPTSITTLHRPFMALDAARNVTSAGQIMQSELEKMRLKDWSVISGYEAGPTTITIDSSFTTNPAIGSRFTLTRSVADVHTDMKSITLTIAWKSYDGRSQTRSYQTYYGRNGLYDFFYNSN
jgi:Tfp pilus assembly protein PilV